MASAVLDAKRAQWGTEWCNTCNWQHTNERHEARLKARRQRHSLKPKPIKTPRLRAPKPKSREIRQRAKQRLAPLGLWCSVCRGEHKETTHSKQLLYVRESKQRHQYHYAAPRRTAAEPLPLFYPYTSGVVIPSPLDAVLAVLPPNLPEDVRADAAQALALYQLEHGIHDDDLAGAVRRIVSAAWRPFRERQITSTQEAVLRHRLGVCADCGAPLMDDACRVCGAFV